MPNFWACVGTSVADNQVSVIHRAVITDHRGELAEVTVKESTHHPFAPMAVGINDACRLLGVGTTTLYRLMNEREVKAVKAGRKTLITVQSICEYLERLPEYRPGGEAT